MNILHQALWIILFNYPFTAKSQSCRILSDSANVLYENQDMQGALRIAKLAKAECEKTGSLSEYANILNTTALIYDQLGDAAMAIGYYRLALQTQEKASGKMNVDYAQILQNISGLSGDPDTAVKFAEAAAAIYKELPGKDSFNYGNALVHLAVTYHEVGDEKTAFVLIVHSLEILLKQGKTNPYYLTALNNMGIILEEMGKTEFALQVDQAVLETRKLQNDPNYVTSANNLGALYSRLGLYQQALPLFIEVTDKLKQVFGEENANYLSALNNIASTYESLNQYDSAGSRYQCLIQLLSKQKKTNTLSYANTINNYALLLNYQGKKLESLNYLFESLSIRKNILKDQHPLYIESLGNYGRALADLKNYAEAIAALSEAVSISKKVLGEDSPEYEDYVHKLASVYLIAGKSDSAGYLFRENSGRLIRFIQDNFSALSGPDRELFINQYAERFDAYASFVAAQNSLSDQSYNGWLYNNMMFKKSLLLTSDQLFLKSIRTSLNTSDKRLYDKWRTNKNLLAEEYTLPAASRTKDFQALIDETKSEERKLAYNSNDFKAALKKKVTTWQDIQGKLQADEAAIEFIDYAPVDSIYSRAASKYAAIVILKTGNSPIYIPLFDEAALQRAIGSVNAKADDQEKVSYLYSINSVPQKPNLYNLIWAPLSSKLEGVTKIYFSPTGILNNISFAALRSETGQYLIEKYDLVQLANTRDVIELVNENKFLLERSSALIFSGIRYDYPKSMIDQNDQNIKNEGFATLGEQNILPVDKTLIKTYAWNYLQGSEREGKHLQDLMNQLGMKVANIDSTNATEENFKMMATEDPPDILHIATHGFFFEAKHVDQTKLRTSGIREQLKYSENPMLRSGLVFAGANYAWQNGYSLLNREDGILTADEVSNLDLSAVKLVVLSACQSGSGDVVGDEGNFGLQRGFRLAGVKKLIISLWRVSDDKTGLFMEAFYRNWSITKDIEKAFRETQISLLSLGPYIAFAFILVE